MYVTPVVYPVTVLPERWQWLLSVNPMTGVVNAYRTVILGRPLDAPSLMASIIISVALFVFGLHYFRRMETQFADIV